LIPKIIEDFRAVHEVKLALRKLLPDIEVPEFHLGKMGTLFPGPR